MLTCLSLFGGVVCAAKVCWSLKAIPSALLVIGARESAVKHKETFVRECVDAFVLVRNSRIPRLLLGPILVGHIVHVRLNLFSAPPCAFQRCRFWNPKSEEAIACVALVEFNSIQESVRLFFRHRIASGLSIAAEVDRIQHGRSATDAEHAADKIPHQNGKQGASHISILSIC